MGNYLMISTKLGDIIFLGGGREVGESNERMPRES